jgi:hypothetical protein
MSQNYRKPRDYSGEGDFKRRIDNILNNQKRNPSKSEREGRNKK